MIDKINITTMVKTRLYDNESMMMKSLITKQQNHDGKCSKVRC